MIAGKGIYTSGLNWNFSRNAYERNVAESLILNVQGSVMISVKLWL